jgi:hypothetical protein
MPRFVPCSSSLQDAPSWVRSQECGVSEARVEAANLGLLLFTIVLRFPPLLWFTGVSKVSFVSFLFHKVSFVVFIR